MEIKNRYDVIDFLSEEGKINELKDSLILFEEFKNKLLQRIEDVSTGSVPDTKELLSLLEIAKKFNISVDYDNLQNNIKKGIKEIGINRPVIPLLETAKEIGMPLDFLKELLTKEIKITLKCSQRISSVSVDIIKKFEIKLDLDDEVIEQILFGINYLTKNGLRGLGNLLEISKIIGISVDYNELNELVLKGIQVAMRGDCGSAFSDFIYSIDKYLSVDLDLEKIKEQIQSKLEEQVSSYCDEFIHLMKVAKILNITIDYSNNFRLRLLNEIDEAIEDDEIENYYILIEIANEFGIQLSPKQEKEKQNHRESIIERFKNQLDYSEIRVNKDEIISKYSLEELSECDIALLLTELEKHEASQDYEKWKDYLEEVLLENMHEYKKIERFLSESFILITKCSADNRCQISDQINNFLQEIEKRTQYFVFKLSGKISEKVRANL